MYVVGHAISTYVHGGALPLISVLPCIVECPSVADALEKQEGKHSSILLDQLCLLPTENGQNNCDLFFSIIKFIYNIYYSSLHFY